MNQRYSQSTNTFAKRFRWLFSELDAFGCLFLLCIVVGVPIALPLFLTSANEANQLQGKQYVGSMSQGQQAYFAEKGALTNSIAALDLGIKTEKNNYKYSIRTTEKAAFNYGVSKQQQLKSYVSGVFVIPAKEVNANATKDEITTRSILCEAASPGTIEPAEPTYQNGKLICGKGTTKVTK